MFSPVRHSQTSSVDEFPPRGTIRLLVALCVYCGSGAPSASRNYLAGSGSEANASRNGSNLVANESNLHFDSWDIRILFRTPICCTFCLYSAPRIKFSGRTSLPSEWYSRTVFGRSWVQICARRPAVLAEAFQVFSQPLQKSRNSTVNDYDTPFHILSNSFFINHPNIWCCIVWATDGVIK
jgi:hypothetical protein